MSVRIEGDILFLEGRCGAEDAETLLVALRDRPGLAVDASGLLRLHLAVAQVLLAVRPIVHRAPDQPLLARAVFGHA